MRIFLLLILIAALLSCESFPESRDIKDEREELRSTQNHIKGDWVPSQEGIYDYFEDCIKGVDGAEIYPIWFRSLDDVMSGLVFKPEFSNQKSVLMIHGYAGNTKGFKKIINHLLKRGFTIAALSLPGHELSGGKRGDVGDFNDYGHLVNDYLTLLNGKIPPIDYAIAHSTGCSSLIIYNEIYGWEFKQTVFIAPLIRSYAWRTSLVARFLSEPFIDSVNTMWKGPFAVQSFPFHWFDELHQWNTRLKRYNTQDDSLYVFQGDHDEVVSWKYNMKFIGELYPRSVIDVYKYSNHVSIFTKEPHVKRLLETLDALF